MLFTTITALLSVAVGAQQICPTGRIDDLTRQKAVNFHNDLRSSVAKGTHNPGPRGQNIYALTYDCSLEAQAQAVADTCRRAATPLSHRPGVGENLYVDRGTNYGADHAVVVATSAWWNEIFRGWFGGPTNTFTTRMIALRQQMYAQVAWGATTRVGCGFTACRGYRTVVCRYSVAGAVVGQPIVQPGIGCTAHTHCTLYHGSTCDVQKQLCLAPGSQAATTAATATATECPGSPLTPSIRNAILIRHNSLRSRVARMRPVTGHQHKRGTNRMFALRYSCALEARARVLADLCPPTPAPGQPGDPPVPIPPPTRGQNSYTDIKVPANSIGASFFDAIAKWTKQGEVFVEGKKLGEEPNTLPAVGHFAQMINARTYEIGCGYGSCDTARKVVLCMYRTQRTDNGIPYTPMSTTTGCTLASCQAVVHNATCNITTGLCQIP